MPRLTPRFFYAFDALMVAHDGGAPAEPPPRANLWVSLEARSYMVPTSDAGVPDCMHEPPVCKLSDTFRQHTQRCRKRHGISTITTP